MNNYDEKKNNNVLRHFREDTLSVSSTHHPPKNYVTSSLNLFSIHQLELYAKTFSGKLLLPKEMQLPFKTIQLLEKQSYVKKIKGIEKRTLFAYRCVRCNNRNRALFQRTPCISCGKHHYYCRNCIQLGKITECTYLYEWQGPKYKWPRHQHPLSWDGTLTFQQEKVSKELVYVVEHNKEHLIWAVTGSGKTEMLFPCLEDALKNGKRVCIATPRADVVRELLPRLHAAFSTVFIQALYGGSRDNDGTAQMIIATTHQLLRFQKAFDLLIIDEVDAFPYHQDPSLQFAAKRAVKKTHALIYLTATPRNEQLLRIYNKQLAHSFVPLRFHHHLIPVPTLHYCPKLTMLIKKTKIPQQVNQWLQKRVNKSRQLLIFVPTIEYAKKVEAQMAELLIAEKCIEHVSEVTSVTSDDLLREEKIKAFRQKELYCLLTTTILERGVTFPSVDVAVVQANHPVFDEQALVQITGRVGRAQHDPTGEVIFFHDGKTNGIARAIQMVQTMNKKAVALLSQMDEERDH